MATMLSNFIATLVSLLVIWYRLLPAVGLQCPGCRDKRDCPSVVDCPGGTVPDPCGCCLECARVANQTCGGRYRSEGKCDEGLVCVITPRPGAVITGEEVGVCRGMHSSHTLAALQAYSLLYRPCFETRASSSVGLSWSFFMSQRTSGMELCNC